jgi:hypothetical protein
MSGSSNGVPHQVLDQLRKFQAAWEGKLSEVVKKHNDLSAHITAVEGSLKNVAAFTAAEMGKTAGLTQRALNGLAETTSHIDKNVLALAELCKELVGQITQIEYLVIKSHSAVRGMFEIKDVNFTIGADGEPLREWPERTLDGDNTAIKNFISALAFAESDIAHIKADAEKRYADWVAASFKSVRERIEADDKAHREQQEAAEREAKEAAERAATAEAEAKAVEKELQMAGLDERALSGQTSGGSGSPFPEGAVIFGDS